MTPLVVPDEYSAADAAGINDSGQVVGGAMSGRGPRAFVWTPDSPGASTGTTLLLNSLDTSGVSEAGDINNHGQVVGWSYGGRAFLWDADGGMRDLNLLLDAPLPENWSLIDAVAINDAGQILARGQWASGDFKPIEHAFLLTPVSEPACALLAAAVSAALLRRPRRR
jgi:probable HAF family extracellular repeat protein